MGRALQRLRDCVRLRRQRLFACADPAELSEVDPTIPVSIEPVTPDNVDRVSDFRTPAEAAGFRDFLQQGQLGLFAVHDGRVVGHAWAIVCHDVLQRVNGYFDLLTGEAMIHFCNVKESCRGHRIYPAMLVALARRLFIEEGVRSVQVDSEVANAASIRGIARAGFREIGRGTYVQVFGRLLWAKFADTSSETGKDSSRNG